MIDAAPAMFIGLLLGGVGTWAVMRHRSALLQRDIGDCVNDYCRVANDNHYLRAAHARCSDALNSTKGRIERALEQVTPGANATVKRMASILRGDA